MHPDPWQALAKSQVYAQVRMGRVSSVDKDRHTAQVQFDDVDGFVSWDLQVLITRDGDYSLPSQNAPVVCMILDGRLGAGFVLGSFYTENDEAPLNDVGQRAIVSNDLRLGTADASNKIALGPKCKNNFDDIKDEFDKIKTTLGSLTGGASAPATFGTPYEGGYTVSDPSAEDVAAK